MFGFQSQLAEQNERLLMIAESVKSGLSLSDSIRLVTFEGKRADRPFIRFADLLDQGVLPQDAVERVGFSPAIHNAFQQALTSPNFADAMVLQSQISQLNYRSSLQFFCAISYPFWLILVTVMILHVLTFFIVPQMMNLFNDFDVELPQMTQAFLQLAITANHGGLLVCVCFTILVLYLLYATIMPRLFYKMPIWGSFSLCRFQSSLIRTIAFSLKQGITLNEILLTCGNGVRNRAFRRDLRRAATDVSNGKSFQEVILGYPWLFPVWLVPLISSSSDTESQAEHLERAADKLESQLFSSIWMTQTVTLIFALIFIIAFSGMFIISLFLPLLRCIETLSS